MPIASPGEYAEMLDAAAAGGYAYPAVSVTSSQTLNAVLSGLAEAGSDGIAQISVGGGAYLSGGGSAHAADGAVALAALARELAARVGVRLALHTDHCPPEQVANFLEPLLEASEERHRRGEPPLFGSHMFDGSTLPLDENLARSRELLERCRDAEIVLEMEVGVVGGEEDGITGRDRASRYTTSADLLATADALGTGERGRYLLAATFGNVHGHPAPGDVELRPGILEEGQDALARHRPGARFDYVFHGSSGSSAEDIRRAVAAGVVKLNLDTDAQAAFSGAVAEHMRNDYDASSKKTFDPRTWGAKAEAAMAARVVQACEQLGSAGRSLSAPV